MGASFWLGAVGHGSVEEELIDLVLEEGVG